MTPRTQKSLRSSALNAQQGVSWLSILLSIFGLCALFFSWYWSVINQPPKVEAITREGVIAKIQSLNRLQTVGFSVDTVISSQKQGNWYNLWQDEQKGLFVAHGRVTAGINLNKLTPEQVQVSPINVPEPEAGNAVVNQRITITIPKAEIFEVYLDDIEVYDLKTGLFGLLKTDPAIFEKAQDAGKVQVLRTACNGDVLKIATDNAQKQVEGLFKLTGFDVSVYTQTANECQFNTPN